MCTALQFTAGDNYFGRTLDLDRSYGESVCITPRRYPMTFRCMGQLREHYAVIGMATLADGFPLYYEAANEHGLAMAGLNFPDNAYYPAPDQDHDNIAPFELIPWILFQCKTVEEAEVLLGRIQIADIPFSKQLPLSTLHWMIADSVRTIVVESMRDGLHVNENPTGVMTNNPPFSMQLENWKRYRHLRNDNALVEKQDGPYTSYSQGMGAVGLPGDVSSMSRFVRAAFGRQYAVRPTEEADAVGQFFHLLSSVEMVEGLCRTDAGSWDVTGYSCCINATKGRYYYTTYHNRRISCVDLYRTAPEGDEIISYPLEEQESILYQN